MKITATVKSLAEILKTGEVSSYKKEYISFVNRTQWDFCNNEFIGKNIEIIKNGFLGYDYNFVREDGRVLNLKKEWLTDIKEVPDWEIDTPILVWCGDGEVPNYRRHFAGLTERGEIKAWDSGNTSWTAVGDWEIWDHAKLAEKEDK